jgi:RNA polymerase sigma factor (sigma-70 family)
VTKLDDQPLAQLATRGERRAFEEIFRRYHQDLYRFCLAIVGNPEDAEEALQSTMAKVLRALPGERRKIDLKPWLYRIARNEAIETLRRRRDTVELTPEQAGVPREIADAAADRERLRTLLADLGELPGRQRDALLMRELAGLGVAEIAAALDASPGAARQAVYEARLNLRRMEEGRAMRCEQAMRALSDDDGRVTRRHDLRAHLRSCPCCRAFREEIEGRRSELAALAPLPALAATGILHGLLGGFAPGGLAGGVGAGSVGAGVGKAVATSAIVKVAASVAIVAAVGVSAADREGLVDIGPAAGDVGAGSATAPSPASQGAGGKARPALAPGRGSKGGGERQGPARHATAAHRDSGAAGAPARGTAAAGAGASNPAATGPGRDHGAAAGRNRHRQSGESARVHAPSAAAHGKATARSHKPPRASSSPGGSGHPAPAHRTPHPASVPSQPPAIEPPPEGGPGSPPAAGSSPSPPSATGEHPSTPASGSP